MKPYLAGLFLLGMFAYGAETARADLITDGGFESDTAGKGAPSSGAWTYTGASNQNTGVNQGPTQLVSGPSVGPHSGSNWFGFGDALTETLSQTVATTPGTNYTLSYWVALTGSSTGDQFQALWNGTPISGSTITEKGNSSFAYKQFTFTVTGAPVVTSGTLTFAANNNPAFWEMDDVSLLAPVPEPSSMALGGLAALGMIVPIGWKWRRSKKTEPATPPQAA